MACKKNKWSSFAGSVPSLFIWLRPEQMFTKDGRSWPWTVFRDPRSSDIEQGELLDVVQFLSQFNLYFLFPFIYFLLPELYVCTSASDLCF